jgi:hypothetical protein
MYMHVSTTTLIINMHILLEAKNAPHFLSLSHVL